MYMHFCAVHRKRLARDPWMPGQQLPPSPPVQSMPYSQL
jgi:hypothetical protein